MKRVFIFGTLAKALLALHYRFEAIPYSDRRGYTRAELRGASEESFARFVERHVPDRD